MKESDCQIAFWCYCEERRASINNMMDKNLFQFHGSNAHTQVTGDKCDISNLFRFKWYDWCYFRDSNQSFPFNKEKLGQVIGPVRGEGNEITKCILKYNGEFSHVTFQDHL